MNFKSFLKEDFVQYLSWRESLGYKTVSDHDNLKVFDHYLWKKKTRRLDQLTHFYFIDMIEEELETRLPQTLNHRLCIINNFFKYLERTEKLKENPLQHITKRKELYYSPATFSVDEIKKILEHLSKKMNSKKINQGFFLSKLSRYTAFYIQAACGMRISEICKLKLSDYDSENQTLLIRKTKFRKDRKIPISEGVDAFISNYLETRKALQDDHSPYLLLTYWKGKWDRKTLDHYFRKALKELGMYKKPEIKGNVIFGTPSTHSLRHSFAVNTIKRWQREGLDIDQISHALAAYLGHTDFVYTQVYLKALAHSPPVLIFKPLKEDEYPKDIAL